MNRSFTLVVFLCLATAVSAQLQVVELSALGIDGVCPRLSPDGQRLAYSTPTAGLDVVDLATGKQWLVSPEFNSSADVIFSAEGDVVAYSSQSYKDHLRYHELFATDLNTGRKYALDQPSRDLYRYRFSGKWINIAKRSTVRRVSLSAKAAEVQHRYVVAVEDDDLVLYDGNIRRVLNPNGKNIYLWASLSPDEKKIVYMAVDDKCHTYVCDLQGNNVTDLGYYIAAPCWAGNDLIVGQQDEDDGHQMTSSRIVAVRADGSNFQVLPTPGYERAINPTAAGNIIVFENDGQLVRMSIK